MYRLKMVFIFVFVFTMATAQVSVKDNPIQLIPDLSKTIDVDFKLSGGLILMQADNDGKKGNYILDTGAPCIILNEKVKKGNSHLLAVGIGGEIDVAESKIEKFVLGKFIREQIKCLAFDISHIEKMKKTQIAGLIGYELLKDKELLFDYENLKVSFLDENKPDYHRAQKRLKRLPFKMNGHMPLINVKIGKKKFKFGIDTGSEVSIINTSDANKIKPNLYTEVISNAKIQSLDSQKTSVVTIDLEEMEVSKREVYEDVQFIITDLTAFNEAYGVKLDGLLGYSFLKERLHSIDFKNKELVIWE